MSTRAVHPYSLNSHQHGHADDRMALQILKPENQETAAAHGHFASADQHHRKQQATRVSEDHALFALCIAFLRRLMFADHSSHLMHTAKWQTMMNLPRWLTLNNQISLSHCLSSAKQETQSHLYICLDVTATIPQHHSRLLTLQVITSRRNPHTPQLFNICTRHIIFTSDTLQPGHCNQSGLLLREMCIAKGIVNDMPDIVTAPW